MKYKKHFNRFMKELDRKLKKGFEEYGDISFRRSTSGLISEMQEECLDFAGWGIILWVKLEEMKNAGD